jgi:hypothetical protein
MAAVFDRSPGRVRVTASGGASGSGNQAPVPPSFSSGGDAADRSDRSPPAAHLRRFLSRHAKTNGIDADPLARLPLFHPRGVCVRSSVKAVSSAERTTSGLQ